MLTKYTSLWKGSMVRRRVNIWRSYIRCQCTYIMTYFLHTIFVSHWNSLKQSLLTTGHQVKFPYDWMEIHERWWWSTQYALADSDEFAFPFRHMEFLCHVGIETYKGHQHIEIDCFRYMVKIYERGGSPIFSQKFEGGSPKFSRKFEGGPPIFSRRFFEKWPAPPQS